MKEPRLSVVPPAREYFFGSLGGCIGPSANDFAQAILLAALTPASWPRLPSFWVQMRTICLNGNVLLVDIANQNPRRFWLDTLGAALCCEQQVPVQAISIDLRSFCVFLHEAADARCGVVTDDEKLVDFAEVELPLRSWIEAGKLAVQPGAKRWVREVSKDYGALGARIREAL